MSAFKNDTPRVLRASTILVAAAVASAQPAARLDGGDWVQIFDGKSLAGWKQLNGTAKYAAEGGAVVGTTAEGSPNSFLCTEKHYEEAVKKALGL